LLKSTTTLHVYAEEFILDALPRSTLRNTSTIQVFDSTAHPKNARLTYG